MYVANWCDIPNGMCRILEYVSCNCIAYARGKFPNLCYSIIQQGYFSLSWYTLAISLTFATLLFSKVTFHFYVMLMQIHYL